MVWTGLLSKAPGGSVLVCQPNDDTLAHMGELSAETLKARGFEGMWSMGAIEPRISFGV